MTKKRGKDRDQVKEDFCEAVRKGERKTLEAAAEEAGVTYRTILNWREKDPDFDQEVEKAKKARDSQRVAMVEDVVFKRIMEGDAAASTTIFWLKANSTKYRNADKRITEQEGESDTPEKRRRADELLEEFEREQGFPAVPEDNDMDLSDAEDIVEQSEKG